MFHKKSAAVKSHAVARHFIVLPHLTAAMACGPIGLMGAMPQPSAKIGGSFD
jgi:hypothetical protein